MEHGQCLGEGEQGFQTSDASEEQVQEEQVYGPLSRSAYVRKEFQQVPYAPGALIEQKAGDYVRVGDAEPAAVVAHAL
jgi:hypothetical protein